MKLLETLLGQRKLVLTLALLLSTLGLVSWLTMTRQEDPRLPEYWGQVVVTFPGADAGTVERLVLDPIEDHLGQVDELREIVSTANAEVAVLELELREGVDDFDRAWDRVRQALRDARPELPEGVSEPLLDDRQQDQESMVYALTGHPDPLALSTAAEELKDELLAVPGVARVELIADPGEQITIELDDAAARRLGLAKQALAAQLARRTRILPGGSVEVAGRQVRLRPVSELESLAEIRATPVLLASGETVPLEAVARVRRGPREPERARMRLNGERAVGLGVVPRKEVNVVELGRAVRQRVAAVAPALAPLEVREVVFQPDRVQARLAQLNRSLAAGALVVAGVLVLAMGLRLGLIVASVVPLVTLSSLAVYALGGGVLHQMSIAAVVIALGMLVDNAVVMAEAIQWRVDRGEGAAAAAAGAVRELAVPLAGATATTLAAFVPMLLAPGVTAEFTRAIPVVIMLTLTVSYLFALFVTPALGGMLLRPRSGEGGGRAALARRLGTLAVERPGRVVVAAAVLVGLSFAAFGLVRQEFFPSSDRNQLVLDVKLPEGSHLDATDAAAGRLERALMERPEVTAVAGFVGRSAPHFYYNLSQIPWSPHFAQVVVETRSTADLDPVMAWLRTTVARELPAAEVVVRKLEQGPPLAAPVEVRLYGSSLADLDTAADRVVAELRRIPGTADVRHDLSLGSPLLRFAIDDAAAARRGLSRAEVAAALYGATRGLVVGQYRGGDDPVPVVLRSAAGERFPVTELASLDVAAPGGQPTPLAQVARMEARWRPGAVQHRNRRRMVRVLSQLQEGTTYSQVVSALGPRLAALELPAGVTAEMGGAAESSGEANTAMATAVPAGMLLLIGILMAEFRSFRRVGLVLLTVPLAAAGVVPGLLVGGQPFGFMSLLGVMALAGVVVNNAIVLLEVIEARRREGAAVAEAVRDAVERRMRPILLTTATTVVGLSPLALSASTLWPPLAWTMISGLTASTLLTLLVVPALYRLLFAPPPAWGKALRLRRRRAAATVVGVALALLAVSAGAAPAPAAPVVDGAPAAEGTPAVEATPALVKGAPAAVEPMRLTLEEAMAQAARRPGVAAAHSRAEAAGFAATAARRAGLLPSLVASAAVSERDRDLALLTPIGDFRFGDRRSETAEVTVAQPLLEPAQQLFRAPAARSRADAAALEAERATREAAALAAEAFLDVLGLDARLATTEAFITSLQGRLTETAARVAEGKALEADGLKVRLALDDARQDRLALAELRRVAARNLGRAVGAEGSVEPEWAGAPPVPPAPPLTQAVERALASRRDLAALGRRLEALRLEARGVKAEALPRLEATASWVWAGGSPYDTDRWIEAGVRLRWNPFAAATRAPRAAALEAEGRAAAARLTEARRGVEVEVEAALAALATARGALAVGETGVAQAAETLRVEEERHRAGRITTNDLLAAEAALRDQTTRRDLAALDEVRAGIRLELALGRGPGRR